MQHIRIFSPVLSVKGKEHNGNSGELVYESNEQLNVKVSVEHGKLSPKDLVVELYLSPNGENTGIDSADVVGTSFEMKLCKQEGETSTFGFELSCSEIRSSGIGIRVCPKETSLRNLSPGYMAWY